MRSTSSQRAEADDTAATPPTQVRSRVQRPRTPPPRGSAYSTFAHPQAYADPTTIAPPATGSVPSRPDVPASRRSSLSRLRFSYDSDADAAYVRLIEGHTSAKQVVVDDDDLWKPIVIDLDSKRFLTQREPLVPAEHERHDQFARELDSPPLRMARAPTGRNRNHRSQGWIARGCSWDSRRQRLPRASSKHPGDRRASHSCTPRACWRDHWAFGRGRSSSDGGTLYSPEPEHSRLG